MIQWLFPKILGGKNDREVNRIRPTVSRINEIEEALRREPDEKLLTLTKQWQAHLARYHKLDSPTKSQLERMDATGLATAASALEERFSELRGEFSSLPKTIQPTVASIEGAKAAFQDITGHFAKTRAKYLEKILPEAYAVVKNAARRLCGREVPVNGQPMIWNMVHFDVQLIGGIAIHRGMIAEMQTGEGKTLVATLPVYLNALAGLGVHVVTVNDYLAKRDSDWMSALFGFLGLSVGCIQNEMQPEQRRAEYACDITYGTNSEFGFDYLRDNGMAMTRGEQVQRGHYFAIIDEVDSILIDDARTPLIITGYASQESHQYVLYKPMVEGLYKKQTELCNRVASEVERLLKAGDVPAAGAQLYKLKLGQPRNRRFLRFMEDPELRRLLDKSELSYQQGANKKNLFKLKQDLLFTVDDKNQSADLLEKGRLHLSPDDPDFFTLPDVNERLSSIENNRNLTPEQKSAARVEVRDRLDQQAGKVHNITQLLRAYCLYEKDVHYVVSEGKVSIIDESTGREMAGRRWSDGLHQAVEAKEMVDIEKESHTYATITIQNYFRLYEKLAGMTGTAETEAAEFHDIYKLDVLPIPTNTRNIRIDENDQIFKTRRDKYNAVIDRIEKAHAAGQPVLVGTASVESSETLARLLKRAGIPHVVLNAKFHEREAEIVARAGQRGAVTVSTNMAGRGTDIKLGEGVAELGGLFVIATERHPSRRVDRQLRGRCSRQGDPGRSQFFISLEDDLMRHHAGQNRLASSVEQFDAKDQVTLQNSSLGKSVEAAQKQVEQRNYRSRKHVLDFDDVMNMQREIVYGYRNEVLTTEDSRRLVHDLVAEVIPGKIRGFLSECDPYESLSAQLYDRVNENFPVSITPEDFQDPRENVISAMLVRKMQEAYDTQVRDIPEEMLDHGERRMVLYAIDRLWQEHLGDMDELREGVNLRAQGQKDPLVEYKNESYNLFVVLMDSIREQALQNLFRSAFSHSA
ncbi:preprotein translocase subunit SecA [Luteolibacter yonseiensis]|uniref:Protein translocase subunit SecA n=1 Tax=Luteolibacter yonseiensis TaxID=1144680 RepID=A0A934VC47_9BACT|nr:preprotein translocase subunit SecA [Luteolibacter yonseiensis]MBK1817943.1 preprotein translocase subunit SecA [Luteolibacter yonseiensis]